jgi:hypothetical protein
VATFVKMKFSFPQWCNTWEFELGTAEKAINLGPWETKDPAHLDVLEALKSDFCNLYMSLYGIGNILDRRYPTDRPPGPRYTVLIEWSVDDGCYASTIVELPDIVGTGANWDESLREMKKLYNVKRRIQKLENLIESS